MYYLTQYLFFFKYLKILIFLLKSKKKLSANFTTLLPLFKNWIYIFLNYIKL
jgi:hypothetical protein